jgi:hypothetical protein
MNWFYGTGYPPEEKTAKVIGDSRERIAVTRAFAGEFKFIVGPFKSREGAESHAKEVGYEVVGYKVVAEREAGK